MAAGVRERARRSRRPRARGRDRRPVHLGGELAARDPRGAPGSRSGHHGERRRHGRARAARGEWPPLRLPRSRLARSTDGPHGERAHDGGAARCAGLSGVDERRRHRHRRARHRDRARLHGRALASELRPHLVAAWPVARDLRHQPGHLQPQVRHVRGALGPLAAPGPPQGSREAAPCDAYRARPEGDRGRGPARPARGHPLDDGRAAPLRRLRGDRCARPRVRREAEPDDERDLPAPRCSGLPSSSCPSRRT